MAKLWMLTLVFPLPFGIAVFLFPIRAYGAACDAFVTRWAWFIGGEVTVNRDGTFVQQSGNAGTWECTDPARGRITMRWRDGGFVNSLVVSPDGQNIISTDLSQSYVTARRSGPAPGTPVVRQENCCQEAFGCETKKIEAEYEQKMARCHFPGNSGCIAEATSTKASRLKAANERLRSCNRTANEARSQAVPNSGGSTVPTSNDEFHSTDPTGAQPCQPCDSGTDGGGDTFASDEPDCLPPIDAAVLRDIQAERNQILAFLASGGAAVNLNLDTIGKVAAARLQHMTEPNEGIPIRTARQVRSTFEHAPESIVKAGEAVAKYLTNNSAANHRLLYGQMQAAISRAEADLKQMLRNPHITIATVADTVLIGKLTGAAGTVCRQYSATKITQLKNKIEETRQAGKVVTQIKKDGSPNPICGQVDPDGGRDCAWQAMAVATGDRSWFLRKDPPTPEQFYPILEQHFGGDKAKHPMTRRPGALQSMAAGRPVPVTQDEFVQLLHDMPDGSEYMVWLHRPLGSIDHIATLAKIGRVPPLLWDNQLKTSNLDVIFADGRSLSVYRYK